MKTILIHKGVKPLRNGNKNPREYPYWDELISLLKQDFNVIEIQDKTSLPELKKIILEADTWIGVESFFQHYCWSLGKSGFVLWGQGDPKIFGHKENTNLIKSYDNIREDKFLYWENVIYKEDVFINAQEVYKKIKGE